MARRKTKKQKKQSDSRVKVAAQTTVSVSENREPVVLEQPKQKIKTTIFTQSQVKLLYKDLLKTLVVTVLVFIVLLSIFIYMR